MRVAVLGAGVTGLVAARELSMGGHRVDVYERWPGLGGQAATLEVPGGERLERYYHHLFATDRHIVALYEALGLPDELEWRRSSVAMFTGGRSHPFTSARDLLRFTPLSLPARLRMGAAVLALQRLTRSAKPFERITASEWVRRYMGREVYDEVWGPLLTAKFGARAEQISMAWLWSKLTLRRELRGRELNEELLGYPRGSWERLFTRLAETIEQVGGRVLIDRPATALRRSEGGGFELRSGAPGSFRTGHDPRSHPSLAGAERYDAVLATVPSDVFDRLLDDHLIGALGADYMGRVRSSEYYSALCLLLEVDRQVTDFYWTNVLDPALGFIGLVEHTNFVEPERYGGRRFLYVANYVEANDPLLKLDADALLEAYEPGLRAISPGFSRSWVKQRWAFHEPAAQPVVTVDYRQRMPPLKTGVPGLVLANTTQIYPEDRGTNYSVRLGAEAVAALLDSLPADRPR